MADIAVLWDGQRIGRISEPRREGSCIFGRFVLEDGFEVCRVAFEAAYRGDEEYASAVERTGDPIGAERRAWHAAIEAITPHITLQGEPVEEFNVFADNEVEIYLFE